MLIDFVNQNAEQRLLSQVERGSRLSTTWGALHFKSGALPLAPAEEDLLQTIGPALEGKPAAVYFCHDRDIIIAWSGVQEPTTEVLSNNLYKRYAADAQRTLHTYYDLKEQGTALGSMLHDKLKAMRECEGTMIAQDGSIAYTPSFSAEQLQHIKQYGGERRTIESPSILIVEDQDLSRKLLEGMLSRTFTCHCASNAEQAVQLYAEHIPSITFLDVELPDLNGHALAAFLKQHDPDSFIVMVTANNYEKDVTLARQNNVQGFIIKPYSKKMIMQAMQKFQNRHALKAQGG